MFWPENIRLAKIFWTFIFVYDSNVFGQSKFLGWPKKFRSSRWHRHKWQTKDLMLMWLYLIFSMPIVNMKGCVTTRNCFSGLNVCVSYQYQFVDSFDAIRTYILLINTFFFLLQISKTATVHNLDNNSWLGSM